MQNTSMMANRLGAAFNKAGPSIQNASFQLQDIIVQMQMGVPITRTLGQQLPQLLGGFGPLGAVLGVAAGAMASLLPLMFDFTEEAEDAEEASENFADALNMVTKAVEIQISKFTDLKSAYEQAQAGMESLSLSQLTAQQAILGAGISDVGADLSSALRVDGAPGSTPFMGQSTEFMNAATNASMIASRVTMEHFIDAFDKEVQSGNLDVSTIPKIYEAVEQARQSYAQLDALESAIENLKNKASGAGGTTGAAAVAAGRLRSPMLRSGTYGIEGREGFGITGSENIAAANARIEARLKREEELTERVEKAKLAAARRSLDERIRLEKEAEREMERAADSIGSSFERAFLSIIDGTKDAKAAFSDMAQSIISDIAKIVFQQSVSKPIAGFLSSALSGFFGGFFGGGTAMPDATVGYYAPPNAKGGAFSNGVKMFAKGGVVGGPAMFGMQNGMGMMGEAGPEAILPLKRGPGGNLGVEGTPPVVNVNIVNENGGEVETSQNGPNIEVLIKRAVAQDIKGGGTVYGAISKTFNIRPEVTRRA